MAKYQVCLRIINYNFDYFSYFIVGVDFAHASNGYVYHTKYDHIDLIKLGTYQHSGDNLLAMLRDLGNSDEIADTAVGILYLTF